MQFFDALRTVEPQQAVIPVALVIAGGMLREFLEDLKRWKKDVATNNVNYKRITSTDFASSSPTKSMDLKVGDILEMNDECIIPIDCILFQTEEKHGESFVQTTQLDGERNLKPKYSLRHLQSTLPRLLETHRVEISYILPDKNINDFRGQVRIFDKAGMDDSRNDDQRCFELDIRNFLHRGTVVKNSGKIYALAIYAGQ
eukprot:CAMPEP_0170549896 /NCGR_PEP_ID=MMETSP0211-20121228/7999_1 /TAXON_ID=311385 /ORGANISM="Pseudokeronopsis sp., Strain OXSARD2" /LENGTH=199 /DNA_ID=CAMNT_0010856147 /DNA_START=174 /DNA_END=773 /DNA_ORIENTATION=+